MFWHNSNASGVLSGFSVSKIFWITAKLIAVYFKNDTKQTICTFFDNLPLQWMYFKLSSMSSIECRISMGQFPVRLEGADRAK